jgi:arylformamidase
MTSKPSVRIDYTADFKQNLKQLHKKYRNINHDLQVLIDQLESGETPGDQIVGVKYTVYKVRIKSTRYADGDDLAALKLEQLAHLDGVLVRVPMEQGRVVGAEVFKNLDVRGKAVLVHTGWARHWKSDPYFEGHSFLTEDAANVLKAGGAALVGIDSYNIDDITDMRRPVHSVLLHDNILIVEHMCNLEAIPEDRPFKFYAVPVKIKNFGTFPVRAFAVIE